MDKNKVLQCITVECTLRQKKRSFFLLIEKNEMSKMSSNLERTQMGID
jgi:hypothetical protein